MSTQTLENNSTAVGAGHDLFDSKGRCIPADLSAPVSVVTRHYFKIKQPEVNPTDIYNRISKNLGKPENLTAADFSLRLEKILRELQADPSTRNIVNGVKVPFFIPKRPAGDMGAQLEATYLPAVSGAYADVFPEYSFKNNFKDTLKNRFSVAPESRHNELVSKISNEDVVGYYFPCLLEYSIPAMREIMAKLPNKFLLAGGFDTVAAMVGSPSLLFNKTSYPPLLWFAALEAEKSEIGYFFEAYGYNLTFNRKPHFGSAAEYWAAGLVVLG